MRLGKLVLSGNDIGDIGAATLAVLYDQTLFGLLTDHNRIGLEGIEHLRI